MERPKGLNVDLPFLSRSIVWQGQGNNEPQQQLELQLSCQETPSKFSTRSVSFRQELPVQCLEWGANGNLLQLNSKIHENYRKFIKAVKLIMSAVQLFLAWHRQVTSRPAIQILSVHLLLSHFAFPFEVPWPRSHHKSAVTPRHVDVRAAYPHLSATSCAMRLETLWTFKKETDYSKDTLTAATARKPVAALANLQTTELQQIGFWFTLQSRFTSLWVLRVCFFRDDVVSSHVSISNAFRKARSLKFPGCQECVCTCVCVCCLWTPTIWHQHSKLCWPWIWQL